MLHVSASLDDEGANTFAINWSDVTWDREMVVGTTKLWYPKYCCPLGTPN
jgi:hypothetical protein